jgi:hypothetical protein
MYTLFLWNLIDVRLVLWKAKADTFILLGQWKLPIATAFFLYLEVQGNRANAYTSFVKLIWCEISATKKLKTDQLMLKSELMHSFFRDHESCQQQQHFFLYLEVQGNRANEYKISDAQQLCAWVSLLSAESWVLSKK